VGDRIQLNVRVPLELSQELRSVLLKNPDEKNSLDQAGWYLDPSPQMINGNLRFIISPIKTGKLTLPELLILKADNQAIAKSGSLSFEVAELSASPTSPPELLETISISLPLKFVIIGILLILVAIALVYWAYNKFFKNNSKQLVSAEIKLPPTPDHVIALRELNLLYDQNPYSNEHLKPIAFGISQILKNFFSSRFKIDAKESTTDEMMVLLRQESLTDQDLKKIIQLFKNLDLIKFTELAHHQHFQKSDYLEFKEQTRVLIESWAIKGDFK
jgi:hypothetical protein